MSVVNVCNCAAFWYDEVYFVGSGAPKQTAPRHPEKPVAKPNSPKGKVTTQQRQAAAPTTKTAASGAASAPKKSMSSRREELLKQLKAVEDAIARKRAKMT